MSSTFETLPDEILMIIFKYSGDVHEILRTFLGLNQRLNRILTDKRFHLLTDFLSINRHHSFFTEYYNSVVFQEISRGLLAMNGPLNEDQLSQYSQSLISFDIQEHYKRSRDEFQSNLTTFEVLRQRLTSDESIDVDNQLNQAFNNLQNYPINITDMKQIEWLVLTRGARLQCDESEQSHFNLAIAINRLLHSDLNNMNSTNKQFFHLKTQMFKALITANPDLLTNRDYYIYSACTVWFFLFYAVYRAEYYPYSSRVTSINMMCYQAVVNLLFFTLQYQKLRVNIEEWTQKSLFAILKMIPARETVNRNGFYIMNVQWEVLKIITDIYVSTGTTSWYDDHLSDSFQSILGSLVTKNRTDVILFIYRRLEPVRHFFNQPRNCQSIVDQMTGSRIGRQLLETLINEKPWQTWITSKEIVFTLVQKKERKLLEQLLRLSSLLVHQIDKYGNDPVLYLCLKVRGCRHRLVELLITMKSDLQRKNIDGENFLGAIKLRRNQELVEKLNVIEIININDTTDAE